MTDPSPASLLWIDGSRPAAGWRLWGMNLIERLLREGARRGLRYAVVVVTPDTRHLITQLRPDLARLHDVDVRFIEAGQIDTTLQQCDEAGFRDAVVVDGDVVHDDRVLDHLLTAGPGHAVAADGVMASHQALSFLRSGPADGQTKGSPLQITKVEELGRYVPDLRLTMTPFLVRVTDAAELRRMDRLLFHRTFKGVIDAVARYGYYHFVRWTTRWLSRTAVSPNLLTVLSILGIWLAIPCFAVGQIGWGIASAWAGVILDSVDGKLARLTVNLSDAMGALEHAAAMPGLGLWFVALGWHLSDGQLLTPSSATTACWVVVVTFLADKILTGVFKKRFGFELFDARPLDAAFHLIAARRNIHLLLLTIGLAVGDLARAFDWMAIGMVGSFAFHLLRAGWIALTPRHAT